MVHERGSVWNKWDFHVHTPYSVLYNKYGFSLTRGDYESEEEKFDEYVSNLFTKAIENEIVAIGITDYFSIDGYKRIKKYYFSDPKKMQTLFPDESLREKIKNIYIFPNIELRIDKFVGEKEYAVDFHVIFSGDINIDEIEENFLQCLKILDQNNNELPLTKSSIEKIGKDFINSNKQRNTRNYYSVGMEKITVNDERVLDIFKSNKQFQGRYLISIPVDEDLSSVSWNGRSGTTRIRLYRESDLLMTPNIKTRDWALAKDNEEEQIQTFRSIKPCIWGSDAHEYSKMFAPDDNKYCWIKAKPSFEGLMQVIYEPADRVAIQSDKPEIKNSHQIIDKIIFKSNDFPSAPIYFSEGLTTIIGGKSTGKSILLRHIAKNVDSKQVDDKESIIKSTNGDVTDDNKYDVDVEVYWKDGASGKRNIIYIPQSWLNRLADEKRGDSQLNKMLEKILFQQENINSAHKYHEQEISAVISDVNHDIVDYFEIYRKIQNDELLLQNEGRSEQFYFEIKKLETKRNELSIKAGITPEILQKSTELRDKISSLEEQIKLLNLETSKLEFLEQPQPFIYIPGFTSIDNNSPSYDFSSLLSVGAQLKDIIKQKNEKIDQMWKEECLKAQKQVSSKLDVLNKELNELKSAYQPYEDKIALNEQLQNIEKNISEENNKLHRAEKIENRIKTNTTKAEALKRNILKSRIKLSERYVAFQKIISDVNSNSSNLKFSADVGVKKDAIFEAIQGMFSKKGFHSFKINHDYDLQSLEDFKVDDGLFEALWDDVTNEKLQFKAGNDIRSFLGKMFADWFYIHYGVKSGNDTIVNMSPGKKALVLLELIVNLDKSNCPILIDQPEDDLDNRSIYSDLVQYLKKKKRERQIIVVTHNANVVIGADAEEVIIANQDGKGAENYNTRFEYRCGAIESVLPKFDSEGKVLKGILNGTGIQQQICEILEGGKRAFELRRNKYVNINL